MNDNAKAWIWSFVFTLMFVFCFAALYLICYKYPAFYDAILRVFGGSGEMASPQAAMARIAIGIIPCTFLFRVVIEVLVNTENNKGADDDCN